MKVKTYPQSIKGAELAFVQIALLSNGKLKSSALSALPDRLKLELKDFCSNKSDNLSEVIYWIVNGLNDYPKKCVSCGNSITKFHSFSVGYPHNRCSSKCANADTTVKNKKQQTSLIKYGSAHHFQSAEVKTKIKNKLIDGLDIKKFSVEQMLLNQNFKVLTMGDTLSDPWQLQCECGEKISRVMPTWSRWNTDWKTICPSCSKGSSHEEKQIAAFVKSLGFKIIQRDRKLIAPLELDIVVPVKNLAIEYNGLYWHSDNKLRHQEKYLKCKAENIKLIQIFENDWRDNQELVKSRLRSALGLNTKLHARKTSVKEITFKEASPFYKLNHLQGSIKSGCLHIGLFADDELVQCLTIGKSRFTDGMEILRSASLRDRTVVGGLSKLISFLRSQTDSKIITYADLCWGSGESYLKAGGRFIKNTEPGYFWWKGSDILNRMATTKNKLPALLPNFDSNFSQEVNLRSHGYRKIWNAGHAVFYFD